MVFIITISAGTGCNKVTLPIPRDVTFSNLPRCHSNQLLLQPQIDCILFFNLCANEKYKHVEFGNGYFHTARHETHTLIGG